MKASEKLKEKIREFEGYSEKAYKCPAGVWTCGYGHTKGVTAKTKCTKMGADAWLTQDLAPIEAFVNALRKVDTQGKFDALVDFAYNLGLGNLRESTLLKYIRSGASTYCIQEEFKKWKYSNGKVLTGLVKRREWEAQRWTE